MKIIGHLWSQFLSLFLNQLRKRGILFLSPEDMQEAKKSVKEKCIKAEDVKNLPPIEEIHGLNLPPIEETYDLNHHLLKKLMVLIT